MRRLLKNCFLVICYMVIFLPKAMAAPLDNFNRFFVEITQKYQFCFDLEKMVRIECNMEAAMQALSSENGTLSKSETEEFSVPHEIRKNQFIIDIAERNMIDRELTCRNFSFIFSHILSREGIKNWLLLIPSTTPEALDGHMANLYVDPSDNQLYVADGSLQAQLNMGALINMGMFKSNPIASVFILKSVMTNTCGTLFLHNTLDDYLAMIPRTLRKNTITYINVETSTGMSYRELLEDYISYYKSHPLGKK